MAYHGYLKFLQEILSKLPEPKVLEIGVDRGISLIPLVTSMALNSKEFVYVGIDIKFPDSIKITMSYMPEKILKSTYLIERNSLEALPNIVDADFKFDVILLDGDHNYETVSTELLHMDSLLADGGFIIADDYSGKWKDRDLYYSSRPGYENIDGLLKPSDVTSDKVGVNNAIDDWLASTGDKWQLIDKFPGEPVLIHRK